MMEQVIVSSTGKVILGEWNRNFDEARAKADSEHIPMIVFYGGLSCGVCEILQRALDTDEFKAWQAERKLLMVFTTDNSRGAASSFSNPKPTKKQNANPDEPSESGFPYIAVYWNRDGAVPEKFSPNYRCFRGKEGMMPAKGGSLMEQFIRSVEYVAGEYPYSGGEFALPDTALTGLEVEAGYPNGFTVKVPLVRTTTSASLNQLVFNGSAIAVEWAEGETGKLVEVLLPEGLPAGTTAELQLLSSVGSVHATSSITIVPPQGNSLRNPKWVGEEFAAGEWTMDLDRALEQMEDGQFEHTLVFFTGALWCPHCQAFEESVFATDTFRNWAVANQIALVELDNPRRFGSTVDEDLACHEVRGAAPSLLRYEAGMNSYLSRLESGASYLTRKGIAVGDASTPGTAEYVLQRNRRLGYEWGEGTYCAPDGGRCGYPTVILLNRNGSIAGRLNRLETESYSYDLTENMNRFEALLRLSGGAGESSNFPRTTTRAMSPGAGAETVDFQVNDRVEYFALAGLPTGRVSFSVTGAPAENPVTLSVVRYADGVQSVLAKAENAVTCAVASDTDLYLKAETYSKSRAYGTDTGFTVTVTSSLILVPAEGTSDMEPQGRDLSMEVVAGTKYRLDGFADPDTGFFRDEGEALDGGRYYTALKDGVCAMGYTGTQVSYQVWRPGVIAFAQSDITLFKAAGTCHVPVIRSGGSSGSATVTVKVVGGDAEKGVRYEWNEATVVSWADGESGEKDLLFRLKDYEEFLPNQTVVLGLTDAVGSGASEVSGTGLEIMICDTDKPTLAKTEYDIPIYATFDAEAAIEPQKAYNVEKGRVTIKKAEGKLPPGVKLVYEEGQVKLSGSPTKPGSYSYTFVLQQRQGGKTVAGPEIRMSFVVAAPSDISAGGNALLGSPVKATLPLYAEGNGGKQLAGVIEYSVTGKNIIKAKCLFLEKKAITFKGRWATMADGNAETGALVSGDGRVLRLTMTAAGAMTAVVENPRLGTSLSTFGTLRVSRGGYAAPYAGYYTVALREVGSEDPMGDGFVLVKTISAEGKAKWSGVLANGKSVSGSCYVTLDDSGNAVLPVFKYTKDDWLAVCLKVRPDGSTLAFPRAVLAFDGTLGCWSHHTEPASLHRVEARGCWYNQKRALDECCYLQFFGADLSFRAEPGDYHSEAYGDVPQTPEANVFVSSDSLGLNGKNADLKLKFSMKTGVVSGSMKIAFPGKTVTGKYKGVVIPGWHDCHCELPDPADPYRIDVSQPFAAGALWFSDKVGGRKVFRGFPVVIDERLD